MVSSTPSNHVFVGREQELAQLCAAYNAAASGDGGLVMVTGEPGIGKTALCEQLAAYVREQGGTAVFGHCYEEGSLSLPYLAFIEVLREYASNRDLEALRAELADGAALVGRIVPELRTRLGISLEPAAAHAEDRWRLMQAVADFLRAAATGTPLAVFLEDLHWADGGTLDLLQHLARNLGYARLLIVGTYRDVEVDRSHPLSSSLAELRRAAGLLRLQLRGLTLDEVHRYYEVSRGNEVPRVQAELVHRQTEGNPLFVQELLRYLVEEGYVVREGGRYVYASSQPPESVVPEGLRDVVGKRLNRLSETCNRLLSIASVIGRDFRLDTLQKVTMLSYDQVVEALEEAMRGGVLEELARPGLIEYRFTHAFFRQTLYEEMSAARRLRFHQDVARALEEQFAQQLEGHATELAEHFSHSTDVTDLAKALHYGEMAAQQAMSVYAYSEAVRLLERCREIQDVLDPHDREKTCSLLLQLGSALNSSGEPGRVIESLAQAALDKALHLEDQWWASQICDMALEALMAFGARASWQRPEARLWAEESDRFAPPDSLARVRADIAMARVSNAVGEESEAVARLSRALMLARKLGDNGAIWAASAAILEFGNRNSPEFASVVDDLVQRSRHGVSLQVLRTTFYFLSNMLAIMGRLESAKSALQETKRLAGTTHQPNLQLMAIWSDIVLALLDGRVSAALELAEQLANRARELGLELYARAAFWPPIYWLTRLAGWDQLPPTVKTLWGDVAEAAFYTYYIHLERALAEGRPEDVKRIVDSALRDPQMSTWTVGYVVLECTVRAGNREAARAAFERMKDVHMKNGSDVLVSYVGSMVARILGEAAAYLGEPDEARRCYEKAIEVGQELRLRPDSALTRASLAGLLLNHYPRERAAALHHLDFAIGEFEAMGMEPSLEGALALRDRATAAERTAAIYPDGLSGREVEVLRLLAAGKSNAQIAEELVISQNTVIRHVSNIFAKIGSENRTEAASYAHRNNLT